MEKENQKVFVVDEKNKITSVTPTPSNSEMIVLKNGSTFEFKGIDEADNIKGLNFNHVYIPTDIPAPEDQNINQWEVLVKMIKQISEEKEIKQGELAKMIGVKRENLNRIFNLRTVPTAKTLFKLINALDIKLQLTF